MLTIRKNYETDKKHKVYVLKKKGNEWVRVGRPETFLSIYTAEAYAECMNRDFYDCGKKSTMKTELVKAV